MARRNSINGCAVPLSLWLAFATLAPRTAAQESVPPGRRLAEAIRDEAREWLAEPTPHERVGESLARGRLARLLEAAHVELQAFERAGDDALALGFAYDLAKTLRTPDVPDAPTLDFVATGHVALDASANPDDFLDTSFRLRWSGSVALDSAKKTRAALAEELPVPEFDRLAALGGERLTRLTSRLEHAPAVEDLRSDADFQELSRRYQGSLAHELTPELAWGFDLHAGLESTQNFSSRQVVLGSTLAGRLIAWDPESALGRGNVFDAPAAALRWLSGEDEHFRLSGEALPTIAAGLDVVDAERDDVRAALSDDHSFLRARLELSLGSRALHVADEDLRLSAHWRAFQEIDAPSAVRDAGTDDSSHLVFQLELPRGWSLSYAAGRLPLDQRFDTTFALGYELRL